MSSKASKKLPHRPISGPPSTGSPAGTERGFPSAKLLQKYLPFPEQAICLGPGPAAGAFPLASRTARDAGTGIPPVVEAFLALFIARGEYEEARKFASRNGVSERMLIEGVRKFCRELIEESGGTDPELALEGFPHIVEIAKGFGLEREKEEAVLEWCRMLLRFGDPATAAQIAVEEISLENRRKFAKECLQFIAGDLRRLGDNLEVLGKKK